MTEMPDRIARLPKDERGYPIPWNIVRSEDGTTPFFIINDDTKAYRALRESLCPICGERLGKWRWFAGGPRSAFDPNGAYLDLPAHRDCMEFALQTCPYLAMPRYSRYAISIPHVEKLPPQARFLLDETVIPDRPEVFVAVCCAKIALVDRGPVQPYLKPVAPCDWTYWRHGKRLTVEEALPFLRAALGEGFQPPI